MNRSHTTHAALLALALGATGLLSTQAQAQTGYFISGSMSNFDCTNRCDTEADEMEIELEHCEVTEIVHTYTNGNYGPPTVTVAPNGTSVIVSYRHPQHPTQVGSIEHFGVTTRPAFYYGPPAVYHPTHVRWYRGGRPCTVNGQVPIPGGGTAPATQPSQPIISTNITTGSQGHGGLSITVTNTDATQSIWIMRSVQITNAPVTLEALMPNDPIVTTSFQLDSVPLKLAPSASVTTQHDLPFEIEEEQSAVFNARYFQDLIGADPFMPSLAGPELGNVMTAHVASKVDLACEHSIPTVDLQPASVTQNAGTRVDLRVSGRGDDASPITYLWMKDGVALTDGNGISGSTSNHLRINSLQPANEGFYTVRLTNTCATILSDAALVFITGHNTSPMRLPPCAGDFDGDASVNVADIFAFLGAYFNGFASADFDHNTRVEVPDIFAFLSVWFAGCA